VAGLLAIDAAKTLGWAHCLPGGPLRFGHQTLGRKGAEPGQIGAALSIFLSEAVSELSPDLIVYEQPFKSPSFQTEFVLFGMGFFIDTFCVMHCIKYGSIVAPEATKALTGRAKFPGKDYAERRKAKKLATMQACWARGWKATEDEADAIAVLLLAEMKRFPIEAKSRPMVLKQPRGPLFRGELGMTDRATRL
jgi:hypothetical protein